MEGRARDTPSIDTGSTAQEPEKAGMGNSFAQRWQAYKVFFKVSFTVTLLNLQKHASTFITIELIPLLIQSDGHIELELPK